MVFLLESSALLSFISSSLVPPRGHDEESTLTLNQVVPLLKVPCLPWLYPTTANQFVAKDARLQTGDGVNDEGLFEVHFN